MQGMVEVHRDGFTELSTSDGVRNDPHCFNIVFVHGLRGHPRETWEDSQEGSSKRESGPFSKRGWLKSLFKPERSTSRTRDMKHGERSALPNIFWPKDYLVKDIPQARVWTYGYNADVIGGLFQANNKNSVSQHGRDLAVRLEREIENEGPIMFVAHSLGGIIVKDAIHRSEVCRMRTKFIIFLGTPHRGSSYASWGVIASNLARLALQDSHKKIIETLEVNNEVLDNIHEEFKSIVHKYGTKIHSFQEARGISGMKGVHEKVVDDFSSKLDLPRSLETVESIDANHMQMARCNNSMDPRYRAISGVLKQFMRSGMPDKGTNRDQEIGSVAWGVEAQSAAIEDRASRAPSVLGPVYKPCYYIPFLRNRRFVGRSTPLNMLKQKLFERNECQRVALVGLGGVGKTQVALEFAYWAKENRPEYSVFWVPALSLGSFEQACVEIAKQLAIHITAENEDPKELVRRHLSTEKAGKWLLVVDNADDTEVLFGKSGEPRGVVDQLPESENGLILFTTRHREAAVSLANSDVVELQAMDQTEALGFLEMSLTRRDLLRDNRITIELLKELTYLPLAITQAVAYLNINQVSISDYLQLLRGTEQNLISLMSREFRDSTRYRDSENAVATTWLVSFDQLRKSDVHAADLLSFISRIEPKAIPHSILPPLQPEEKMVHAIGTLRAYAFVAKRGNSDTYDIHRLVHLATRIWVQKHGTAANTTENATRHLAKIFPSYDYESREVWRGYLPHALRLLQDSEGGNMEERYDLCVDVGNCLYGEGRIRESVKWLLESYQWRKAHLAEDHPDRLASQHALASVYKADGQIGKAVKLLEHVVAIREKVLEEDHPNRLASQHALAGIYEADGQIGKAVKLLEHVVAVREKVLEEDHPNRLASQHALASVYRADGQIGRAVKLLEHVVAVQEVLEEDHPNRLASQHVLASVYEADGQIGKAVKLLEYVVAVREKVLEEDHPRRLVSQHALASVYKADGQIGRAVKLLEHVVAVREKVLEEDHPNRLASQHQLAVIYFADEQVAKAIKLLKHVVVVKEKVLRQDHPERLRSERWLSYLYSKQKTSSDSIM